MLSIFYSVPKKKEFPHKKEPVTVGDSAVVRVVLISSGRSSVGAFLPFSSSPPNLC